MVNTWLRTRVDSQSKNLRYTLTRDRFSPKTIDKPYLATTATSPTTATTIDTSITHIRPRFKFTVSHPPEEVLERISTLLAATPPHITGKIIGHHIILDIVGEEVHYWSPQLNFRVEMEEYGDGQTVIAGLIGPRPNVWTLFMFAYFSIGIAGFFITSYGISRYMLGEYSPALWGLPLAAIIMATAYQAGKFGEKLGAEQVDYLKSFVSKAVGTEFVVVR